MARNRRASDRMRLTQRGIARRDAIHAFIVAYESERHRAPTVREIAQAVGIASSTAEYHIAGMIAAGSITRDATISRGIGLPVHMSSGEG